MREKVRGNMEERRGYRWKGIWKGKNNDSTLRYLGNPLASLKWVSKNYFVFLNP
jgi:hypothetical protein